MASTPGAAQESARPQRLCDTNFEKTIKTDATCHGSRKPGTTTPPTSRSQPPSPDKLTGQEMAQLAAAVNVEGDRAGRLQSAALRTAMPSWKSPAIRAKASSSRTCRLSGYKTLPLSEVASPTSPTRSPPTPPSWKTLPQSHPRPRQRRHRFHRGQEDRPRTGGPQGEIRLWPIPLPALRPASRPTTTTWAASTSIPFMASCTGWNIRADLPANVPYAEAVPAYAQNDRPQRRRRADRRAARRRRRHHRLESHHHHHASRTRAVAGNRHPARRQAAGLLAGKRLVLLPGQRRQAAVPRRPPRRHCGSGEGLRARQQPHLRLRQHRRDDRRRRRRGRRPSARSTTAS